MQKENSTAAPYANREKLLQVLAFTLVFSVMNATVFNVVLPIIGQEFSLNPSALSWISTGYIIVYAIGSVTYGKLADKFRLKDLLTFGLSLFALGSLVGLAATEYWMIILGRVLQAAGASVIPATGMIIPVRYFPPEQRGRALGTSAIGLALGGAMGPTVSGVITGFANWRFLFLLSVLPLVTLPFYRKYLDDKRGNVKSIDFTGGALLAATVALLLLSITNSSLMLLLAGCAVGVLLVWRLKVAPEPFFKPELFRNRNFSVAVGLAFAANVLNFGLPFITPQFLSGINGLTPLHIGLIMFPAALVTALLGRKGGKLADSKGNLALVLVASGMIIVCLALLSTFAGISPYWILFILMSGNVGISFMGIAMSNTVSRTLSSEDTGVGMGLFSMMNFISGAASMSLIGRLLDNSSTSVHFNPVLLHSEAAVYSNIFVALAGVTVLLTAVYVLQFGRRSKQARSGAFDGNGTAVQLKKN